MKRRPWLQIFITGLVLFIATEEALRTTGNPNFFPTVLLIGSFLIPVTFVVYFYEHVIHHEISLPLLTACFVVGGILGVITAGLLEFNTLRSMGILSLFGLGLIEESVKLIFPVFMYLGWRYRHAADGLLFGLAAGMGFAALETMGYGMVTLIKTSGDIDALRQILLLRGFLSPAGHAAWTGFVCAVLWRERERKGHVSINLAVITAFATAVVLHTLWNMVNTMEALTPIYYAISVAGNIIVAGISLTLLIGSFRKARWLRVPPVPTSLSNAD